MSDETKLRIELIKSKLTSDFEGMYREAGEGLPHPFLTPGSVQYEDVLWDWDSWLSNVALRQVFALKGDTGLGEAALKYERGCVLNFLSCSGMTGYIPIVLSRGGYETPETVLDRNMHKPCLAQHAAFIIRESGGDASWLREDFKYLQYFLNNYKGHHRHEKTGLYFWQSDSAIGVDNDPCTFGRPLKSSGSIYLNSLMYRELLAAGYIADQLNLGEIGDAYRVQAEELKVCIQKWCWDEKDGFYYSVDLNIGHFHQGPNYIGDYGLHDGYPCDWPCLIQRIGVWSGFLAMWSGVATDEQANRMVEENLKDTRTFNAAYGVRTLSKLEKMYNTGAMGNPSSWLGPVWGVSNYMTFRGLVRYGYEAEAAELVDKTIKLFGRDLERFDALHEYYLPDSGEPVLNPGFQNWNYLVLNMIAWMEGSDVVVEF